MANPNKPFGFEVIKTDGKEAKVSYFVKKTGSAIYPGDCVKLASTGDVEVAAAGDVICGVAAEYKAATSTDKIAVYADPELEFMVQTTGSYAAADVGLNADLSAGTADSTLKKSGMAIDTTTQATTATLQFKILGLLEKGENAVGNYAIIRVKPNNHAFKAGVAGV